MVAKEHATTLTMNINLLLPEIKVVVVVAIIVVVIVVVIFVMETVVFAPDVKVCATEKDSNINKAS